MTSEKIKKKLESLEIGYKDASFLIANPTQTTLDVESLMRLQESIRKQITFFNTKLEIKTKELV